MKFYLHKDVLYEDQAWKTVKFLLDVKKISNEVVDMHNIESIKQLNVSSDDICFARFGHHFDDKIATNKAYDVLTQKFNKIYPSKDAYYYYDDKLKQYEFMLENDIPCLKTYYVGSKEEIEKINIKFPIVTKKTWGAGTEQVNKWDDYESIVDNKDTRSWTGGSIYPCLVQEYKDVDYDIRVRILNSKVFFTKRMHDFKTKNKDNFPYGTKEILKKDRIKYHLPPYELPVALPINDLAEVEDIIPIVEKLHKIQNEKLDSHFMVWDILRTNEGIKILEFSHVTAYKSFPQIYYDIEYKEANKLTIKSREHFFYLYNEILKGLV
tara:strand:+ start:198 stop:1166 length:969 start_codon:yes stop_codon:yes gene_type:complete